MVEVTSVLRMRYLGWSVYRKVFRMEFERLYNLSILMVADGRLKNLVVIPTKVWCMKQTEQPSGAYRGVRRTKGGVRRRNLPVQHYNESIVSFIDLRAKVILYYSCTLVGSKAEMYLWSNLHLLKAMSRRDIRFKPGIRCVETVDPQLGSGWRRFSSQAANVVGGIKVIRYTLTLWASSKMQGAQKQEWIKNWTTINFKAPRSTWMRVIDCRAGSVDTVSPAWSAQHPRIRLVE